MEQSMTEQLKDDLIQMGYGLLKSGGIKAVNIDNITAANYIAKGSFYNIFKSKSDFIYEIMKRKREQSKKKIKEYLSKNGKLSRQGLNAYLHWLGEENPNIFSYLNKQETKWLISKWPKEYIENEDNDEMTAKWILSLLESPKENPDWPLFCNLLKLVAWALGSKEYLLQEAYPATIDLLINQACESIADM